MVGTINAPTTRQADSRRWGVKTTLPNADEWYVNIRPSIAMF
jgi:hypothetical protein